MSTSRGFGKINAQVKEKLRLRKNLREIQRVTKRNKVASQERKQFEETHPAPEGFEPRHWHEWTQESAVDPEIVTLNVRSLSGNTPYDYLCYSDKLPRLNTGALNSFWMRRYAHTYGGGWWASGVNLLNEQDSQWGCFKSDQKYTDSEGQTVKYEHPAKVATELFALKIPHRIWQLISRRYDVALPEGYQDLPHSAFWKWVTDHPQIPIVLTEGCKKAASVLSCGYVCIALPGIWNGIRQPRDEGGNLDGMASLIPQLQIFAQAGRRVYFAFDQDSRRNTVRSVNKALAKTAKLFLVQGCEVKIVAWHPVMGKGIDDLLVTLGREKFDELYCHALTFDEWATRQLRQLTYSPDMTINQRYIGEILPPNDAQLICVKSAKGTGKTEWFRWLTALQVASGERKTLLTTHRIQLSTQTANRLGIPYITEVKSLDQGDLFGYALCVDSMHAKSQAAFNPNNWKGAWLIFDEIQQVIWHLLSSSTCKKNRVVIIKTLRELLRTVIASGGKIVVADADLNDIAVDFIEGLLGFSLKRFILVNEYKFDEPWTVYKFGGKNPKVMITELEKRLQSGERALLCVSAQKKKSRWGSQNLDDYFRRKYPDLKILCIDSETVQNPQHQAFGCTERLNEVVVDYDLVIASPTIETGLSIDVQHFDGVWGIFQGIQSCDGTRQHLSRVRPPVPRYVWIKSTGIGFVGNKSTTPAGLVASQKQLDKANRAKLVEAGIEEMPEGTFSQICLESWAKLGAVINMGMWRYEKTILADLKEEGHNIVDWTEQNSVDVDSVISPDAVEKEITKNRDELYLKYREDVTAANSLTDSEYEKLNKQQQRKTDELLQLRKGQIERKYLVPATPELVQKDDDRWGSKLRLHYFWQQGREHLQFKDNQSMEKAIAHGQGDYFIVDSNRSLMQLKVGLLDYLGIARLYEDTGFHNSHPVVIDILEKIRSAARHIQTVVNLDLSKISKDTKRSIEALQMILHLLGHKMTCYSRTGKRGAETRYYSSPAPAFKRDEETGKLLLTEDGLPIPELDGREEVFQAWLERDAELQRKAEEQKALAVAEEARIKAALTRQKAEEEARAAEAQTTAQTAVETVGFTPETLAEVLTDTVTTREMYQDIIACNDSSLIDAALLLVGSEVRDRLNSFTVENSKHEVESPTILVDEEIRRTSPLCDLAQLPLPELWTRRLSRAVLMTQETARAIYTRLPQQILNEVWERLSYGVQSHYAELFAA